MSIFVLGDLHGGVSGEMTYLNKKHFPEQKELTKKDIVFQLGDFGFLWYYPEVKNFYKKDLNQLNKLAKKNYTTIVVPGNHENHDIIEKLPIEKRYHGRVHVLKLKYGEILFAIHGEVYIINGKKFFIFGGAKSGDIDDRISLSDFNNQSGYKRIKRSKISYWPNEIPPKKYMNIALFNLKKVNFKVDYVLSHTAPKEILLQLNEIEKSIDPVSNFLSIIKKQLLFSQWHFGHIHKNRNLGKFFSHYKTSPFFLTKT
jgi:predicted phosphodiesterase